MLSNSSDRDNYGNDREVVFLKRCLISSVQNDAKTTLD